MVLVTIIIVGVAGAMLGWNVHVMRKHGVSSRSNTNAKQHKCDCFCFATQVNVAQSQIENN